VRKPEVVVGVDGSENSVEAVRWAVDYARAKGLNVRVISAFDIPWRIFITPTSTDENYADAAKEALDSTMERAFPDGTDLQIKRQVVQGRPELALGAASKNAVVLVIGSHGVGLLPGVTLGSVANYCVNHASCPVVVIR
jgi:nucleotide-binding universal stress UspA family protein